MEAKVPVSDLRLPTEASRRFDENGDDGEAHADPVNYMSGPYNEVVHDELGGQSISPSW